MIFHDTRTNTYLDVPTELIIEVSTRYYKKGFSEGLHKGFRKGYGFGVGLGVGALLAIGVGVALTELDYRKNQENSADTKPEDGGQTLPTGSSYGNGYRPDDISN